MKTPPRPCCGGPYTQSCLPTCYTQKPSEAAENFRTLKATLPGIEFSAIQWAAKRAGAGHTAQALDVFMRLALLERVREIGHAEIKRGKAIPPDIAAVMDRQRAGAE